MECPICFGPFDEDSKKPIRTFCRCHQTLCWECLNHLLRSATYCPWDRSRWSGRGLLQKFIDATPDGYMAILTARESRRTSNTSAITEEVDVMEQQRLLEAIEQERRDKEYAMELMRSEHAPKRRRSDLRSFFPPPEITDGSQGSEASNTSQPHVASSSSSSSTPNAFSLLRQSSTASSSSSTSKTKSKGAASHSRPPNKPPILSSSVSSQPHDDIGNGWDCPNCSFRNFPLLLVCELCDQSKPKAAAASSSKGIPLRAFSQPTQPCCVR